MGTIFFGTINLGSTVYSMGTGLGFTDQIYKYARAENAPDAVRLIEQWAIANELQVKQITVFESKNNDLKSYTFPNRILGVSEQEWVAVLRDRSLPEDWIQEDIKKYRELQAKIVVSTAITA